MAKKSKVDKAEEKLAEALEDYSPIFNANVRIQSPRVAAAVRELIQAVMAENKA